jgi:hypothetical protein
MAVPALVGEFFGNCEGLYTKNKVIAKRHATHKKRVAVLRSATQENSYEQEKLVHLTN